MRSDGDPVDLDALRSGVRTPASRGGLFLNPTLPGLAAWLGVRLAVLIRKPFRFGKTVIAARHVDVAEVLRRDLDFRIAPVNAARIEAVNGPFVLGMDRGATLAAERHALYSALAAVDFKSLRQAASRHAARLIGEAGDGPLDAVGGYARRVAGATARRLFGVTCKDEALYLDAVRAIFGHTFLNLGGDKVIEARALKAAVLMRGWLADEIARRRAAHITGDDLMGALMRQPALDDDGVRRNLGGMLVGSIDTTASCVAKILVVVARDHSLHQAMLADLGDPARMEAWCLEALRRWPHNPVVLRQTVTDTALAGTPIKAGSRVFAWTQAAMQDAGAFPEPGQLRPDRAPGAYLHFGGGLHPCAGRAINAWQIPMLVAKVLARGMDGVGAVAWAGPFPDHLPVRLRRPR